ncbi:MAG: thiamine phosphate synthase, partial [Clostridia bacterium]
CLKNIALADAVKKAIDGGVTIVQLREKRQSFDDTYNVVNLINNICVARDIPLIVNDNVEIAKQIGVAGVHLGIDDTDIAEARAILGDDAIIGATAHNLQEALEAQRKGADYISIGAMFSSSTKPNVQVLDRQVIKEIRDNIKLPLIAIGGITADNVDQLDGRRLDGVAIANAIFGQEDIISACKTLKEKVIKMINS